MARVVCIHGISKQLDGEDQLLSVWLPALRDGLRRAGLPPARLVDAEDVKVAFYGDLFRKRASLSEETYYRAGDLVDSEVELLMAWWESAARAEPRVVGPRGRTLARTPRSVQLILRNLCRTRFFGGLAVNVLVLDLKQVTRYLTKPGIRDGVRARLAACIGPDTRVIVAHSLGSVVAYEVLCSRPDLPVCTLVTLGSPLGTPVIFDRLEPRPAGRTAGTWPGAVRSWVNIADEGDIVALEKNLRDRFGPRVIDRRVHNGARAHDVRPYLSAQETGEAIAAGLS